MTDHAAAGHAQSWEAEIATKLAELHVIDDRFALANDFVAHRLEQVAKEHLDCVRYCEDVCQLLRQYLCSAAYKSALATIEPPPSSSVAARYCVHVSRYPCRVDRPPHEPNLEKVLEEIRWQRERWWCCKERQVDTQSRTSQLRPQACQRRASRWAFRACRWCKNTERSAATRWWETCARSAARRCERRSPGC